MKPIPTLLLILLLVAAVPAWAQTPAPASPDTTAAPTRAPASPAGADFPRGRISGYVFGDVYYNAAGDPRHAYSVSGADSGKANIDATGQPITRDLDGVQLRRIYFQLDNDLSARFTTRFRLEADSRSLTQDGKITAFVKNAYIQARNVYPRGDLFFGMLTTPIWENAEEFWAYRAIEKTLGDFRGIGSATDLGIEAKGFVDAGHHLGYAAMIGDGQGQKPENNRYKRFYLSLPVRLRDLRVEPYVDYENGARGTDRATYKLFAGYELWHAALGVELIDRVLHAPAGNQEPRGASVFARWSRDPAFGVFGRLDLWQPDKRNPDRVDSRLWMAGLDWQPFKDVHLMPNLEGQTYVAKGTAAAPAHDDLQPRITVFYKFSKPSS